MLPGETSAPHHEITHHPEKHPPLRCEPVLPVPLLRRYFRAVAMLARIERIAPKNAALTISESLECWQCRVSVNSAPVDHVVQGKEGRGAPVTTMAVKVNPISEAMQPFNIRLFNAANVPATSLPPGARCAARQIRVSASQTLTIKGGM